MLWCKSKDRKDLDTGNVDSFTSTTGHLTITYAAELAFAIPRLKKAPSSKHHHSARQYGLNPELKYSSQFKMQFERKVLSNFSLVIRF